LHKPVPKLNTRLRAPAAITAVIAMLAMAGTADAQDPAADQYAPTTPSGGGNVPISPIGDTTSPVGDPTTHAATDDGVADTTGGSGTQAAPSSGAAPGSTTAATRQSTGNEDSNKAQRTVDKLAADARSERDSASGGANATPAAELLRTDKAAGSGMGAFLWIVLGGTLLWAIVSGVTVLRGRRADHGPDLASSSVRPGEHRESHQTA